MLPKICSAVGQLLLAALGVICIAYSIIIYNIRSGSKFFFAWDLAGIILIAIAAALRFGWFKRLPSGIVVTLVSILGVGVILAGIILVKILSCYNITPQSGLDCIIVLGAQVKPDGPSVVLNFRLEKAVEYLTDNPDTICIVSGAQGYNEPCTEASAMKEYLTQHGIEPERIILEEQAVNTRENIIFSKKLLPENSSVGILTNNFHMFRSLYLAEKKGIKNPKAVPADSIALYEPNNVAREILAFVKDLIIP